MRRGASAGSPYPDTGAFVSPVLDEACLATYAKNPSMA
jgi:hypothetical protein